MRYVFPVPARNVGIIPSLPTIKKEETIQRCLEITEGIVGDSGGPNTDNFTASSLGFDKAVTGKLPQ
jgi:hypothetical protein